MTFKRWPHNKHDSRVKPSQLERYSTVDPLVDRECLMLDGSCLCKNISECKHLKEVEKGK